MKWGKEGIQYIYVFLEQGQRKVRKVNANSHQHKVIDIEW